MATLESNIAKIGHDTDNVMATDLAYKGLHSCCKYDRKTNAKPNNSKLNNQSCNAKSKSCKDKCMPKEKATVQLTSCSAKNKSCASKCKAKNKAS